MSSPSAASARRRLVSTACLSVLTGVWLLCRLEGECQSLRVLQAEAEASCATEKRAAETLRADLTQREVLRSEDVLFTRPLTSATLCALQCVTGACSMQECLRVHADDAVKHTTAMEALERGLEAALAQALLLQGQLDSEISGHRDTQASLQRAQEQVQPQRTLPGCPELHNLSNAACNNDRRVAAKQATSVADLHAQSQRYCAQLQEYNANLQRDMQSSAVQLQASALQLQRLQVSPRRSCKRASPWLSGHAHASRTSKDPSQLRAGPGRVRRRRRRARKRWQPCAARCTCAPQS